MTSATTKPPVPNRLAVVPQQLYDLMDKSLSAPDHVRYRMVRVIRIAYTQGYTDGYRDGHTDAENGHDERVRATVS